MPQLVRAYGKYATRLNPYARTALTAFANRHKIMRAYSNYAPYAIKAAKVIGRAGRYFLKNQIRRGNARPRKRARIGQRLGLGASKRREVENFRVARSTYILYANELSKIPAEQAIYEIDKRQRPLINLRGVKVCMEVISNIDTVTYMNLALVSYRSPTGIQELPIKWFRSTPVADPAADDRAIDFNNNTMTGMEYHCRPINNDNRTVHFHYRYKIGPDRVRSEQQPENIARSEKSNLFLLQKYIPIKRQLRYSGVDELACTTPIFLCYWFSKPGDQQNRPPANSFTFNLRCLTYFKDTH